MTKFAVCLFLSGAASNAYIIMCISNSLQFFTAPVLDPVAIFYDKFKCLEVCSYIVFVHKFTVFFIKLKVMSFKKTLSH